MNLKDIDGLRMGIWEGTMFGSVCDARFPNCEQMFFNGSSDLAIALMQKKIDAFLCDEPVERILVKEYPKLIALEEMVTEEAYSFLFSKTEEGKAKQTEFNRFLKAYKEAGKLEKLENLWFGDDEESKCARDFESLSAENGSIKAAVMLVEPFSYVKNNEIVGYCLDLFYEFCEENGYGATIEMQSDAVGCIMGVTSGKYDVFVSIAGETEERKQTMLFSDSVYDGGIVVVVRKPEGENYELEYKTKEELEGKRIGVLTGTLLDHYIDEYLPPCKKVYVNNFSELLIALTTNKIDAFMTEETIAQDMLQKPGVGMMEEPVLKDSTCIGVNKNKPQYAEEFNQYLASLKESGQYDKIYEKWIGNASKEEWTGFDFAALPEKNGRIRLGFFYNQEPNIFLLNNLPAGFEIELIYNFCKEKGYAVDAEDTAFTSVLTGCATGLYDIAAASISWTKERAENMGFTDPIMETDQMIIVRTVEQNSGKAGFFVTVIESFEKNFIREQRWKLVLSGLGITVLLSIVSLFFGTLLGFSLWFLRRKGGAVTEKIVSMLVGFIQGIPVVVLLMVLYYVVFAKSAISGIVVGVIGFSINFAVYVSEIFRSGIGAVDAGQWEAASALGFSGFETFTKVILPQAMRHILPVFKGEFISMVKMTSVVGYIAVQDLTKASDIIRSRTYDALFPLIATAILYFLLSWVLTSLLSLIEIKIDPRKRRRVLADIDKNAVARERKQSIEGKKGETLITLQHLKKEYENVTPIQDISTEIRRGDVISIIGPSGTGKSTLLRCINRMENPRMAKSSPSERKYPPRARSFMLTASAWGWFSSPSICSRI